MEKEGLINRYLVVKLDEEQVALRSAKLAQTVGDLVSKRNELDALKDVTKTQVKTIEGEIAVFDEEIDRLARAVRDRSEMQMVACETRRNDLANPPLIETYRTDTGERIDFRPQTVEERQRPLPFPGTEGRLTREPFAGES